MRSLLAASALILSACAPMDATLKTVDEIGCDVEQYKQTSDMLEFSCA